MEKILGIGSTVFHLEFGDGVVINFAAQYYTISFIKHGIKEIKVSDENLEARQAVATPKGIITKDDLEQTLYAIFQKYADWTELVPLGDKWVNGKMVLKPNNPDLAPKEVPIETFFHKIVIIRDRLRVLEQKVNSSKGLNDEEKVDIQQYITRCYGTLTTFNILFKHKEHHFVGEKGVY